MTVKSSRCIKWQAALAKYKKNELNFFNFFIGFNIFHCIISSRRTKQNLSCSRVAPENGLQSEQRGILKLIPAGVIDERQGGERENVLMIHNLIIRI